MKIFSWYIVLEESCVIILEIVVLFVFVEVVVYLDSLGVYIYVD